MRPSALLALAIIAVGSSTAFAAGDDEVAARKVAYDVAGAFTNDGFRLRDGYWSGKLEVNKPQFLQVNLLAGNQYWFSLGASGAAAKISVSIFDEAGKVVEYEPFNEPSRAAAGFSPAISGAYYIKVLESEGKPGAFCLIYSYK